MVFLKECNNSLFLIRLGRAFHSLVVDTAKDLPPLVMHVTQGQNKFVQPCTLGQL